MSNASKELIEHVNAQLCENEEIRRQTKETIEIKRRLWIEGETRRIIAEQGADITDEEFEMIAQESLRFMDEQQEQQGQRTITVNEMQLGGQ